MADTDKTTDGLVGEVSSDQLANLQQVEQMEGVEEDVSEEDILSQALVDVSEFADGVEIHYQDEDEVLQESPIIASNNNGVRFISSDNIDRVSSDQLAEHFVNGTYQVLSTEQNGDETRYSTINEEMLPNGTPATDGETELGFQQIENESVIGAEESKTVTEAVDSNKSAMIMPEGIDVTVTQPPPLGSSQNPIRIIQQGNQYTPVQQLSTDQLQQIMQVVQQQQMTSTIESGSSILFNPQTNTRIVYRVIYPSELHKDSGAVTNNIQTVGSVLTSPKKVYKKRIKEEDTEIRELPSLSKEEKDIRKKARAKTRSGRVSKPPKHMVKDFKHIHVLDYDEDYDDSDGGYSDYKVNESGDEDQTLREDSETSIVPGLNAIKPKNWKCVTCEKAYIGRAGLGRHLKLNPTHGSIDLEGDSDMIPPPPGSEIIMNGSALTPEGTPSVSASNGISNGTANSTASLSEDSRDSSYSLPYTATPVRRGNSRGRPRGNRSMRGRGAYSKIDPEIRRRHRLKDLVKECTDEELMEIVLPRLAKVITLWEFLLMKVEKGDPAKPHADDVYMEYEKLNQYVKKLCQEYLQFLPEADDQKDMKVLQVENGAVAEALGLQTGVHKVKEISDSDTNVSYKYKFLTTNHSGYTDFTNKSFLKRTVEVVSPEQIVSPTKKMKNGPVKFSGTPIKTGVSMGTKPVIMSVTSHSASKDTPVLVPTSHVTTSLMLPTPVLHPMSTVATSLVLPTNLIQPTTMVNSLNTLHNNLPTNTSYSRVVSLLSNSPHNKRGSGPVQQKSALPSQKFIIVSGMNPSTGMGGAGNQTVLYDGNLSSTGRNNGEPGYIIAGKPTSPLQTKNVSNSGDGTMSQRFLLQSGDNSSLSTPLVSQSNVPVIGSTKTGSQMYVTLPMSTTLVSSANMDITTNTDSSMNMEITTNTDSSLNMDITTNTETLPHASIVCSDSTETIHDILTVSSDSVTPVVQHTDTSQPLVEPASQSLVEPDPQPLVEPHSQPLIDPDSEDHSMLQDPNTIVLNNLTSQHSESTAIFTDDNPESQPLDSKQGELTFTVNSDGILTENITLDTPEDFSRCELEAASRSNTNEMTGVNTIDSTDTRDDTGDTDTGTMETESINLGVSENSDLSSQYTNVKFTNDASEPSEIYQYEENTTDTEPVETIQIPATNIFQTEDGAIFIQNQDGTFIQLQSSDGQNVSMETVQALLANDGEFLDGQEGPPEV